VGQMPAGYKQVSRGWVDLEALVAEAEEVNEVAEEATNKKDIIKYFENFLQIGPMKAKLEAL